MDEGEDLGLARGEMLVEDVGVDSVVAIRRTVSSEGIAVEVMVDRWGTQGREDCLGGWWTERLKYLFWSEAFVRADCAQDSEQVKAKGKAPRKREVTLLAWMEGTRTGIEGRDR